MVGASIVAGWRPHVSLGRDWKVLLFGAAVAVAPDLDLLFLWPLGLGRDWHRGFTHSIAFALMAGCLAAGVLGASCIKEAAAYGSAVLSHGLLDFLATKKYVGVELFWPLSAQRFKLGLVGISEFAARDYPRAATLVDWLKPCLIELIMFAPVFLAVMLLKRRASSRRTGGEAESNVS